MRISALSGTNYNLYNNKATQNVSFKADPFADKYTFYTKVDENLYRGRMPEHIRDLEKLKDLGITKIVSFEWDLKYDTDDAKKLGMECYVLPFDCGVPSNEIIDSFFDITDKAKENNEKVYVHCLLGQDRTGLMVDLYKLHNDESANRNINFYSRMVYENYLDGKEF